MKKSIVTIFLIGVLILAGCAQISFSQERTDQEYEVDENTIALWHFNEGNGTILYDETNNSNDGVIQGATWTDGYFDSALSFDGNDDYVVVPYSQSIGELPAITLEAQIFRNSNQDGAIIAKNGPYSLYILGNKIEAGIYPTGDGWHKLLSTTTLESDKWYHIAMTFDGNYLKIYIDGIEDASMLLSGTIQVTSQDLYFGWYNGASAPYDKFFNGTIDEARISDIAREFGGCTGDEYFCDDFNDGNADGWEEVNGPWFVQDGWYGAYKTGSENNAFTYNGDFSWTDYEYSVDVNLIEGADRIVLFRTNDVNNTYWFNIRGVVGDILWGKTVNGDVTIIDQLPFESYLDRIYHIDIVSEQNNFEIYIDDELYFNSTDEDASFMNGRIGLEAHAGGIGLNRIFFDNVKVNLLEIPPQDTDHDGIPDELDNCINTFNPSQSDLDQDNVGDWCDNCILKNNPDQLDTDGDCIGNACEGCRYRWQEFCIGNSLGLGN